MEGDKVVPKLQRRGRARYKCLEDPIFLRSPLLSISPVVQLFLLEAPGSNLIVDLADSEIKICSDRGAKASFQTPSEVRGTRG